MGSVIQKNPNNTGRYRYLSNVIETDFSVIDWEYNPDVTGVTNIPQQFWKYDGTNTVVEMTQVEKDNVDGIASATTNELGEFAFGNRGKTTNRWLRPGGGQMMPSNRMPVVVFNDGVVTGINFTNYVNGADTDLCIYKNGSLAYTWEIRDKRYAYKTDELSGLTFAPGDLLSVYLKKVGSSVPNWVMVSIQYRYTLQNTGEGGSSTL